MTCRVGELPPAHARIAIGPPDFSPGLPSLRVAAGRAEPTASDGRPPRSATFEELEELVTDIFERALETSDLLNKDAQTGRSHSENWRHRPAAAVAGLRAAADRHLVAAPRHATSIAQRVDALPVSFHGQRKHRRLNALEYLKDRLRDDPAFVERWLRPPLDELPAYDRRMPPLMRGSDGRPMHLSRRQYELVIERWAHEFASGHTN